MAATFNDILSAVYPGFSDLNVPPLPTPSAGLDYSFTLPPGSPLAGTDFSFVGQGVPGPTSWIPSGQGWGPPITAMIRKVAPPGILPANLGAYTPPPPAVMPPPGSLPSRGGTWSAPRPTTSMAGTRAEAGFGRHPGRSDRGPWRVGGASAAAAVPGRAVTAPVPTPPSGGSLPDYAPTSRLFTDAGVDVGRMSPELLDHLWRRWQG